jgi:regulatory protein
VEPSGTGVAAGDAEPDPESVARSIALRMLTGAPRSRKQLADAMARKGVPDEVADRVLDRFTEVGLVDDAAYAELLVRTRHEERGLARRALAMELRRKGVTDDDARAALETLDDDSEEAAARALLERRWRRGPAVDQVAQSRRMLGMLARRGYPSGLASRLVREMVDDRTNRSWDTLGPD